MKFQIQLIIVNIIIIKTFSIIAYFQIQLSCADDYIDSIISSEGNIEPINPSHTYHSERNYHYIYYFNDIKHNLDKEICVQLMDRCYYGYFAFVSMHVNEYDITILNYEEYYHCDNCNINTNKKFRNRGDYCLGSPVIETYSSGHTNELYNTFCLNPTNDISIFYINENKIDQNFYKGNTIEYILNNDNDTFSIDNLFSINGKENYTFDLDAVSFKIINITNKYGELYNGNEELFNNSFFNAKDNYLIHKRISNGGYIMIINIVTKPRNQNITISTCIQEAKIILNVSKKNQIIIEETDNYIQTNVYEEIDYYYYIQECVNYQIIYDYKIKNYINNESNNIQFNENIINFNHKNNFHVLKCYKLNFSTNGQSNNYFSYLFIIFFLINIILIIITHIFLNNNLDNLINYCKAYVDNITNKEFKQLRKIFLNKEKNNLIIKKYNKNFNRFKNEIIFNSPPKKHSLKNYLNSNRHSTILNINNTIKSKDNIDKIIIKNDDNIKYDVIGFFQKECFTNESKHSSHTTEKKEKIYKRSLKNNKNVIKINQNEDNIKEIKRKEEVVNHNYYEYLIFSFPKKERNLFLIEEELNYLDFSYYRHIESRKWYKIFWSIFKINYDLQILFSFITIKIIMIIKYIQLK